RASRSAASEEQILRADRRRRRVRFGRVVARIERSEIRGCFVPHFAALNAGYGYAAVSGTFSLVPDSGTCAPYLRPSFTLGTVSATSVMGRPWVGAMVFTPSRSIS